MRYNDIDIDRKRSKLKVGEMKETEEEWSVMLAVFQVSFFCYPDTKHFTKIILNSNTYPSKQSIFI